jgi:hypothetical protein
MAVTYSTPTGSGCCYNPSMFDLRRRKVYNWFTTITINTFTYGFIQSRLGTDTTSRFNKLNDLFHFINWMILIRKQMDCTGNCWNEYISATDIKCIIARFQCLGIDINCVLIDLDIYFTECPDA